MTHSGPEDLATMKGVTTVTLRKRILVGILGALAVAVISLAIALSHNAACGTPQAVADGSQAMKAVTHRCYGPPAVLSIENVAKPTVDDDQVLVRVRAASINPLEWHYMRGTPYIMRLSAGMGAPQDPRLGVDFAGTVEAVG